MACVLSMLVEYEFSLPPLDYYVVVSGYPGTRYPYGYGYPGTSTRVLGPTKLHVWAPNNGWVILFIIGAHTVSAPISLYRFLSLPVRETHVVTRTVQQQRCAAFTACCAAARRIVSGPVDVGECVVEFMKWRLIAREGTRLMRCANR